MRLFYTLHTSKMFDYMHIIKNISLQIVNVVNQIDGVVLEYRTNLDF